MARDRHRRRGTAPPQHAKLRHRSVTIELRSPDAVPVGHVTLNEDFERLYIATGSWIETRNIKTTRKEQIEPRKRGRPPLYDWSPFGDEVLRLLNLRGPPEMGLVIPIGALRLTSKGT